MGRQHLCGRLLGDPRQQPAKAGGRATAPLHDTSRKPDAPRTLHPHGPHEHSMREGVSRSEEHTSELQSLMRISYAVFCLKKKKYHNKCRPHYIPTQTYINQNQTTLT